MVGVPDTGAVVLRKRRTALHVDRGLEQKALRDANETLEQIQQAFGPLLARSDDGIQLQEILRFRGSKKTKTTHS